jgi:hypothetical protein
MLADSSTIVTFFNGAGVKTVRFDTTVDVEFEIAAPGGASQSGLRCVQPSFLEMMNAIHIDAITGKCNLIHLLNIELANELINSGFLRSRASFRPRALRTQPEITKKRTTMNDPEWITRMKGSWRSHAFSLVPSACISLPQPSRRAGVNWQV